MKIFFILIQIAACIFMSINTAHCDLCKCSKNEVIELIDNYQSEKLKGLIKNGCNLKEMDAEYDLDVFNTAVFHDDIEMVKLLIGQNISINKVNHYGNLSISWCISIKMAEYLIANGIDINYEGRDGLTPLHDLVISGRLEIAKYIIEKGGEINAKDDFGFTPLLFSVTSEPLCFIKYLIKKGANVNAKTNDKTTALHLAVLRGDVDIVKVLIEAGADVNAKNIGKMTPLHLAAIDGRYEIVKLLVESGAEVNIRNIRGKTPLWAAENMRPYPTRVKPEEMNRKEVIEYLKKAGGL